MLSRFMPREDKFFDLFREIADHIVHGAKEFQALMGE